MHENPFPSAEITRLEEASLNGLPALKTQYYDGWLIRLSEGYTRRANSVSPLYPSSRDLDEKIAHCEALYARACLPCLFKLTPASQPPHLDRRLAERGYTTDAPTLVQVCSLDAPPEMPPTVRLYESPEGPFLDTWRALSPHAGESEILGTLLKSIVAPAVCAVAYQGDEAVGCARAVLTGTYMGLFDLLVAPGHRHRGLGTDLLRARLAWGHARGAEQVYLQVVENNAAARRLQSKFAFRETYRYWYRVQPEK